MRGNPTQITFPAAEFSMTALHALQFVLPWRNSALLQRLMSQAHAADSTNMAGPNILGMTNISVRKCEKTQ